MDNYIRLVFCVALISVPSGFGYRLPANAKAQESYALCNEDIPCPMGQYCGVLPNAYQGAQLNNYCIPETNLLSDQTIEWDPLRLMKQVIKQAENQQSQDIPEGFRQALKLKAQLQKSQKINEQLENFPVAPQKADARQAPQNWDPLRLMKNTLKNSRQGQNVESTLENTEETEQAPAQTMDEMIKARDNWDPLRLMKKVQAERYCKEEALESEEVQNILEGELDKIDMASPEEIRDMWDPLRLMRKLAFEK